MRERYESNRLSISWAVMWVSLGVLMPWCGSVSALEATELVRAEPMEGKAIIVEEEVSYKKSGHDQTTSETTIGYEITPKSDVEIEIPVDVDDGDLGDVGLRLKHVFNTESGRGPVVQVEAAAGFPTGEDSSGVDAELLLALSKAIGANEANQIHFNIRGDYEAGAHSDERDFRYAVILGYSRALTPATTLIADVVREQLPHHGENSNMFEVGIEHDLSESAVLVVGAGVGLGEESPDFTLRAGLGFRFGGKGGK